MTSPAIWLDAVLYVKSPSSRHCERSEAISPLLIHKKIEIASSLRSSQRRPKIPRRHGEIRNDNKRLFLRALRDSVVKSDFLRLYHRYMLFRTHAGGCRAAQTRTSFPDLPYAWCLHLENMSDGKNIIHSFAHTAIILLLKSPTQPEPEDGAMMGSERDLDEGRDRPVSSFLELCPRISGGRHRDVGTQAEKEPGHR